MIGCDIVAISRVERVLKRHEQAFLDRILNPSEYDLILKAPFLRGFELSLIRLSSLAGLFAAKEAVMKALGVGICKECSFLDISIFKDKRGAPQFSLSAHSQKYFEISSSSLSISHERDFAIAVCALELKLKREI